MMSTLGDIFLFQELPTARSSVHNTVPLEIARTATLGLRKYLKFLPLPRLITSNRFLFPLVCVKVNSMGRSQRTRVSSVRVALRCLVTIPKIGRSSMRHRSRDSVCLSPTCNPQHLAATPPATVRAFVLYSTLRCDDGRRDYHLLFPRRHPRPPSPCQSRGDRDN